MAEEMVKEPKGRHSHPISETPFEAFYDGSWHGVKCIRVRDGGLFVKFIYYGSTVEHNVSGDHLRLRSRRATCVDCLHVLKPGVDVCVQSPHLIQASSRGENISSTLLCHDARLIAIKRNHNADQCLCLFVVMLYKNQCLGNMEKGKVITDIKEEVVTLKNIFLLQKFQPKKLLEKSVQWNSVEDCLSLSRTKLLSVRFSSEIAHLIALSILRGMEFSIKLVDGQIIYRVIKGDQARCSPDSMSIPPGFGNSMEIISFQVRDETLGPMIRSVPVTLGKKHNLTEDISSILNTELVALFEYMRWENSIFDGLCAKKHNPITVKTDLECLSDVFSYEQLNLRRSKRLKTQPERFTSYDTPNFDRDKWKRRGVSSTKHDNSQRALYGDSSVEVESCCEEVPVNITPNEAGAGAFVVKKKQSSTERRHMSTRNTLVKEKPSSDEVKEKSTIQEIASDSKIPQTPAKNKERNHHPTVSFQRNSFTSSRCLNGNSEPPFSRRSGRKRKERMSGREYKRMINQCVGNIQSEMERDFEFNLEVPVMNFDQRIYKEEDFTWPSSTEIQDEKDELDDLWKDMDYSLTTLALLEQKQDSDSEAVHGIMAGLGKSGEIPCHHDCILDEQIGLICRLCNVVCTEAKDIFPKMVNGNYYNKERPGCSNFYHDDHALDPSLLAILGPEFSQFMGSGNLWSLIPDLGPKLLPHQRKAFEFIWKNLEGSLQLEEMGNPAASTGGCVIAHTPGSGKTLLLISFLVSYLKVHPRSRPLVLTPKSAIHTWRREFEKWGVALPLHVLHHDRKGTPMRTLDPRLQVILSNFRRSSWKNVRLVDCLDKLCKWHESPSVLLMTYSSFLGMTREDARMPQRAFMAQVLTNNPGLLILDEGHNPRSNKSKLRRVLMKVKTEYRILLSGTVFQNNFEEYFNSLSLARPRFVNDVMTALVPERKKETSSRRAKHIEAVTRRLFVERVGQKIESSDNWDRVDGINLLNKLTCGFIDSFEGSKLSNLPGIHIYTLFMKPTDIQKEILSKITMATSCGGRYLLEVELLITIGSIHPWLIKDTKCASTYFTPEEIHKVDKYKRDFTVGCKAKFVIDLLHKSSYQGERVLIFCHNVSPINFLVKLIENVFGWRLGEEVLVLQGDQELPVRSDVMDKFNGDTEGKRKVLIASTTACAEGISLTGASRLVMLDSEWNHSKTRQAIARAFRPGQERTVYVYLLVASGTWEEEKYSINRRKAWMAKMVFHGRYFDDPLQNTVTSIDDSVLKEIADEDKTNTFHMIVKQD
uniref:Uncharacterized protein n=1 Tax=Avena sativa TaxID=4498 RepID=A0ACD5Z1N8_AVESA